MKVRPMKLIIFVGNGQNPDVTHPIVPALRHYGFEVDYFDWQEHMHFFVSKNHFVRVFNRLFRAVRVLLMNRAFSKVISGNRYDIALVVMGRYLRESTVSRMKANVSTCLYWSTDDPFNPVVSSPHVVKSLQFYDKIFTPRPHRLAYYQQHTKAKMIEVSWFAHPALMGNVTAIKMEKGFNKLLSFVGSWSKKRELCLRPFLSQDLIIRGWGWERMRRDSDDNLDLGLPVTLEEMTSIFSTTQININLLTDENFDQTNLRVFEIAASAGCQIVEGNKTLKQLFKDREEIIFYYGYDDLEKKINYYKSRPEECRQIGLRARARLEREGYSITQIAKALHNEIVSLQGGAGPK